MKNVILIGMPGAGKSTIGVVLAKILGYHFIDSDIVIQEQEGKLLNEIIEEIGAEEFNALEDRVNSTLDVDRSVIATGGSAVYGANAMRHFAEIGDIVYLKQTYEEINRRLGDLAERGVSFKEGQTLLDLYNERVPLYEKYADIVVDCSTGTIRELAVDIAAKVWNK